MSFDLEIQQREGYVYVRTWGVQKTVDEQKEYLKKFTSLYETYKPERMLLDERDMKYHFGIIDIYTITREYIALLPRDILKMKVAVVRDPRGEELSKFWENASYNIGLNFKSFYTVEEAERWLLVESETG